MEMTNLKKLLSLISPNGTINHLSRGDQRILIAKMCNYFGLNPLTNPFLIIRFKDGKERLYVTRDGCSQLRHKMSIDTYNLQVQVLPGVVVSTISGKNKHGRIADESGSVNIVGMADNLISDAIMHSTTKAKRRITLDLSGLAVLTDAEIEDMRDILSVDVFSDNPEVYENEQKEDRTSSAVGFIEGLLNMKK